MRVKEEVIEEYLLDRVKATGGICRKQVWPGVKGSPDRFCFWPRGRHAWVELKRPGRPLDAHQARRIAEMLAFGLDVRMIDTKVGVDIFINHMTR